MTHPIWRHCDSWYYHLVFQVLFSFSNNTLDQRGVNHQPSNCNSKRHQESRNCCKDGLGIVTKGKWVLDDLELHFLGSWLFRQELSKNDLLSVCGPHTCWVHRSLVHEDNQAIQSTLIIFQSISWVLVIFWSGVRVIVCWNFINIYASITHCVQFS